MFHWETEEGSKVVSFTDIIAEQGWDEFRTNSLLHIRKTIRDVTNNSLNILPFLLQRALKGGVRRLRV
jgi:hypothetical protein